jgi:hypothetical protein
MNSTTVQKNGLHDDARILLTAEACETNDHVEIGTLRCCSFGDPEDISSWCLKSHENIKFEISGERAHLILSCREQMTHRGLAPR